MTRPYTDQQTQLIENGPFYNANYWGPLPPWVVAGGRAHWHFQFDTAFLWLRQTIAVGADITYLCHFRSEIIVGARTYHFSIGDVNQDFVNKIGIFNETFYLTPTLGGDLAIAVDASAVPGSQFDIWNISVIGIMDNDPMYDMLYANNIRGIDPNQTIFTDLGGGEEMYSISSKKDATGMLIKVE